jgi:protein TonB
MNWTRISIGASLGLLVTVGLFILMPALIESADAPIDDRDRQRIADIFMPDRTVEDRFEEPPPDRPPDPDQPPPDAPQPEFDDFDFQADGTGMGPGRFDIAVDARGTGLAGGDGEYLPIVRVAPIYPRRAQTRGIEGYCTVEFTVTTAGSVRDPQAIDCQPSGYFERASVDAALKFKYRPRVVDGEPVEVAGVRNRFTYELE